MFKNLTGYEIDTLPQSYNLTDGHAFRRWTAAEEALINQAPSLFKNCTRRLQQKIEREYVLDFSRLAGQTHDDEAFGYLMCFTASMAFEVVANYLRLNRLSLTLLEPCFDNLADIFRRHEIPMRSIRDSFLEAPGDAFDQALAGIDSDAICLVTPNNPTGMTLPEDNLGRLVRFCKQSGKLLILDNCFRAYLPRHMVHDQYRLVMEADIDAVLVEDTGKTWPTSEIKAPFFAVSRARGFYDRIYDIYTDFLLHVSPVAIKLMHEFILLSEQDDLASIHEVVRINRQTLTDNLTGTFLTPVERPFASVAWLRIDFPLKGMELKQILDERGVFILPGEHFFWQDRRRGEKYIRVALARDADMFREAAALLGEVCREITDTVRPAAKASGSMKQKGESRGLDNE
jgi:aspartate/methionine/tyrosine aminotransferase